MTSNIFKEMKQAKKEGWLTRQAYKTILGQIQASDMTGALKGFDKLKRRYHDGQQKSK